MAIKRTTIEDVAIEAGVSKGTVSLVLNRNRSKISISSQTCKRVLQAAQRCGYHPNAAARALSTRRTGHIGFILSDTITGGWANVYYATIFAGVEQACRARGYGLNTSLYNLSNIDSFVFPPKVGQRSVDGLILTGYVQASVVQRFREFDIPCVCIGDDIEVAEIIPSLSTDIVDGFFQAVEHLASLGHRNIGFCDLPSRRGREITRLVEDRVRSHPATAGCRLAGLTAPGQWDYQAAGHLLNAWLAFAPADRPSAVISSDQTLIALAGELTRRGLKCPGDLSLISSCNTHLCPITYPALTAIDQNLGQLGQNAVDLLIDYLDNDTTLTAAASRNDFPCRLVVRDSTGEPK